MADRKRPLVDAHAADWEKSQDRGALVREDDSEDGEGGLFAPLPFPSGKDPVNKSAAAWPARPPSAREGGPAPGCRPRGPLGRSWRSWSRGFKMFGVRSVVTSPLHVAPGAPSGWRLAAPVK